MAKVRKIIRQSTVDGPGNRFAVFMQGCNIRCAYCHNPETQAADDEEAREMRVSDVLDELRPCVPFVRGITVSGGECMLQAKWLTELFRGVKDLADETAHPLSCLIDSNGTVPFARYAELTALCDGVMLDVKAWDEAIYRHLTGAPDNSTVKDNLRWLLSKGKLEEVRIVCLPDRVDVANCLAHVAETFDSIGCKVPVRLLRFRPQGVQGELAHHPMPTDEQMAEYTRLAQRLGLEVTVR